MTKARVYSLLQFLRDYGILALTALLIIISIQIRQHENHVNNVIVPTVRENGVNINSNKRKLDVVAEKLDSLLNVEHTESHHRK